MSDCNHGFHSDCPMCKDEEIAHLRQENAELKAEVVSLKNLYRPSISTSVDDLVDDVTGKTRIELQRHKAALEKCREAFGMSTVWPLLDVLKECGVAMRHLLCDHDCDHEGHEQYAEVECQLTDGYIAKLESALLSINSLNQTNHQPTQDPV